jgi:hypothetical protein
MAGLFLNINDVSTHHNCGSKGIRTPDPLHAMQVRYRAAPWTPDHLQEGNYDRLLHNRSARRRLRTTAQTAACKRACHALVTMSARV